MSLSTHSWSWAVVAAIVWFIVSLLLGCDQRDQGAGSCCFSLATRVRDENCCATQGVSSTGSAAWLGGDHESGNTGIRQPAW